MNTAIKASFNSSSTFSSKCMKAVLFHSTPVLDRRRKSHGDFRFNHYAKRFGKINGKKTLLHDYAEHLVQSLHYDDYEDDPFSRKRNSWFNFQYSSRGPKWSASHDQKVHFTHRSKWGFRFCYDDGVEVESVFRSAFGGERYSNWSFIDEENFHWRKSSSYSNNKRSSWHWRYSTEDEYDNSSDTNSSGSDLSSDRLALGLNASGPLKLEEVKMAYRECALNWHPDRHQGSSKVVAEEKFKLCSAAYQSLCENLAMN